MIRTIISAASISCFFSVMLGAMHAAMNPKVSGTQEAAALPEIRFIAGSTVKVQQLLGEED